MRVHLEISKRAGVPFGHAYKMAIKRVSWPYETTERRDWRNVLSVTRDAWQRAYEGQPAESEEALAPLVLSA